MRGSAGGIVTAGSRLPAIDFGNMVAGVLEGAGMDPRRMRGDLARRFRDAHAQVETRGRAGEMGFFDLPRDAALAAATRRAADAFVRECDAFVTIGIGGSALGAAAIRDALLPPSWNELDDEARGRAPRLHILDNPDPDTVSALLARLNPARTLFNVVSKSGATPETTAQFLVAWDWLEAALGPGRAGARFLFTTSAERGPLRRLAARRGIPSLPVPEAVGGRFSVLSPVGLLPAAAVGVDTETVLAGAAAMSRRCSTSELAANPAGALATLLHAADADMGANVHVFMPYADRLRGLALWVQQLWAESLGKAVDRAGRRVETGPTPVPAFGAADQHSILQLLMEGPRDKVVVFLAREAPGADVGIPAPFPDAPDLAYLGGHTLFELLDRERRATAEALRREGRMNMTVTVDRVDARSLGALFMLFQIAVVYAGALYGVDPLNQPGVELGKALTRGLMGGGGQEAPAIPPPDPRWRV